MHEPIEKLPVLKPARQPYEAPAVVYESALEVRAGSPLGFPDPLNPLALPE